MRSSRTFMGAVVTVFRDAADGLNDPPARRKVRFR
jgi:hypothetical protein